MLTQCSRSAHTVWTELVWRTLRQVPRFRLRGLCRRGRAWRVSVIFSGSEERCSSIQSDGDLPPLWPHPCRHVMGLAFTRWQVLSIESCYEINAGHVFGFASHARNTFGNWFRFVRRQDSFHKALSLAGTQDRWIMSGGNVRFPISFR